MCQGIPREVIETAPGRVRVRVDGSEHWMKLPDHLAAVEPGEYVVVYAGVALERLDPSEAREQLAFLRDLEELFPADGDA
jgi:hydrogenase assembly chaperone HypC/HupF